MNDLTPPVVGNELKLWREIGLRYREHLRAGFGRERAADATVSYLVKVYPSTAQSRARSIVGDAITWIELNHHDWLEGRD